LEIKNNYLLFIDDNHINLKILEELFKKYDYRVGSATTGLQALKSIENDPPDLILLDIAMPGMNGFEVCEKLKCKMATKDIPIIFMSANTDLESKIKCFQSGAVDYITKPFNISEVKARIKTHLYVKNLQTKLKESNRLLDERINDVNKQDELRYKFTNMLVHDLKNPVKSLRSVFNELENEILDEQNPLYKYLPKAKNAIDDLDTMIKNLLDVRNLEKNEMPINLEITNLNDLCEKICQNVKDVDTRLAKFNFSIPSQILQANVDNLLLTRIIENLVTNAFKYTPQKGEVELKLFYNEETRQINITVRDTGEGIAEDQLEKIFDMYSQTDKNVNNSSGLSLAFCKLAINLQDGEIVATSKQNDGSTFTLILQNSN